jgi:hypothetical protein
MLIFPTGRYISADIPDHFKDESVKKTVSKVSPLILTSGTLSFLFFCGTGL